MIASRDNNEEPKVTEVAISKVIATKVVVDIDTPIIKTMRYVDGSTWVVDYFNQLSTSNDTISNLDTSLPNTEQQYEVVRNFELKVTTAIDPDTIANISGEAIVGYSIKPSVGDVFKVTLIGNRDALFRVTTVNKKTYNLKAMYTIEFRADTLYSDDPVKFKVLETRVVREFFFNKDSIYTTSDPILLKEDIVNYDTLLKYRHKLEEDYIRLFMGHRGLLSYKDGFTYTDTELADMFISLVDSSRTPLVIEITALGKAYHNTVIDAILNRDKEALATVEHLAYTNTTDVTNDYAYRFRAMITKDVDLIISGQGEAVDRPSNDLLPKFLLSDTSYLFSKEFYTDGNVSTLESLLLDYLNSKEVNITPLVKLIKAVPTFSKSEAYNYTPFILLLINDALHTTNSHR